MPRKIFNDPEYYQQFPFAFEMRLCGGNNCEIFSKIGRNARTLNAKVSDYNLRDEVLRQMDLPIPNYVNPNHFLSSLEARKTI